MFRKSAWLILCLCGLMVFLFGCKQKAQPLTKPPNVVAPATPATNANPTPPPPNAAGVPTPPPGTDTTATDPAGGAPTNPDHPMTAKQAMEQKARNGGTMEEIENLEVPK